jgi:uncharacterized protein (DUF1697 family)
MARHIALLRGINVGGHKKVPMARLRELIAGLGYTDVRTYLNSGNAVFGTPDRSAADVARELEEAIERKLEEAIEREFGFHVSVIVRSRDEIAGVVAANPLADVATDPARYLVAFLDGEVDPERVADLDPAGFAPEAFHLRGREVYIWAPAGIAESRVVKELSQKRLGAIATARNWRTVERLLALADESG